MSLTTYRIDRDGADRLLFLMHGWSAEQHHLAAYVPLIDPDERFTAICPRAPHDLPEGDGASWYERTPAGPDPDSFRRAVDALRDLIETESTAAGVPSERVVVGGFSQGGFLALALAAAAGSPRYAGVWAMCCAMPEADGAPITPADVDGTPALIQVGERDPIITPDRGRAVATTLREHGWDVTEAGYDMAHSQRIEMMIDARDWLATI